MVVKAKKILLSHVVDRSYNEICMTLIISLCHSFPCYLAWLDLYMQEFKRGLFHSFSHLVSTFFPQNLTHYLSQLLHNVTVKNKIES